jgi:hypothetical protein
MALKSYRFSSEPHSVTDARRFVRDSLEAVSTDRNAAEVLVGELATNAVEHARTGFEVCIDIQPTLVRVEVNNDAPELLAVVNEKPTDHGGYGLRLVETLSQHWGTESAHGQKRVWFELARDDESRARDDYDTLSAFDRPLPTALRRGGDVVRSSDRPGPPVRLLARSTVAAACARVPRESSRASAVFSTTRWFSLKMRAADRSSS